MTDAALRRELAEAAVASVARGLNHGSTGNLSVRTPDGMLITPTGAPLGEVTPEDLVACSLDGAVTGGGRPSSEWQLHAGIYRARADAGAIAHGHPTFSTTFACLREGIPAVHYMLASAGGADVRCAEYATFGTAALADHSIRALENRRACLLANHGLIALGATPREALWVACEVESVAELWWRARQVGTPAVLEDEEMARVVERFRDYG